MRYNNQDLLEPGNQTIGVTGATVRQYQLELLEILKQVDKVCRKNNITYFLMYGSLIGAVRHQGFIPWDDDADIALTRENYNRFREACRKELPEEYDFVSYNEKDGSGYLFSRIRKKGTSYIVRPEISRHGRNAGFYVDVFTLDYLSDNRLHACIQKRSLLFLHRLVSPGFSQGVEHLNGFEDASLKLLKLVIGRRRAISFFEKILSSAKKEKASSVICAYLPQERKSMHIFDRKHFDACMYVPFEGTEMSIPVQAITLLHFKYCKNAIHGNIDLFPHYDDENEAIMQADFHRYCEVMYIVNDRTRRHQMEVVFDPDNGSEHYDQYYFSFFDKKKNDRCAVKERHYKEKAAKALAVMTENETIAKLCCKELMLKEKLKSFVEHPQQVMKIPFEDVCELCNTFIDLEVYNLQNLTAQEVQICIKLLLRRSSLAYSLRLLKKLKHMCSEDFTQEQMETEELVLEHVEAYYAVFEGKEDVLRSFVQKYDEREYLLVRLLKGVYAFNTKKYADAEKIFKELTDIDDEQFLAYYYLGRLSWETHKDGEMALKYFKDSLNITDYMPLLQMSLDKIAEINRGKGSGQNG